MIFNKSVFKKLLKTAYKGNGLKVANNGGRIILAGSWWVMAMEERVFTKEGRAALVELTGQLPVSGECFESTSEGNQIMMPLEYMNIDEKIEKIMAHERFQQTDIILDVYGEKRLYKRGNTVVCVNEIVQNLLDPENVCDREDNFIQGAYAENVESPLFLYWKTDECSFAVCPIMIEDQKYMCFLEELAKLDVPLRGC